MDQLPRSGWDRKSNEGADASLAAPVGGFVALVCFFMPWVGCMGQNISASDAGGILWLVFLAAAGIVGAYFHFRSQRRLKEAKGPIISCAALALVIMVGKYLQFLSSEGSQMFSLRFGSIATFFGLVASIYGASQLPKDDS